MPYDILQKLKKEIGGFVDDPQIERVGTIIEAGDGIAKIEGLRTALVQELLYIEADSSAGTARIPALAFNLEEAFIGAVVLGDASRVSIGQRVKSTGTVLSLPVGKELLGRVISPLGEPLDNKGALFKDAFTAEQYPFERSAPSVVERESVKVPLHTGIKAVDAMIPIGRGQRELIIGDRQTGKTAIALDAILNQKSDTARKTPVCIYVAIGQKESKIAKTVKLLEDRGALSYTIVVSASASAPASLQYIAPYAGCAIGEYFMDQGQDVLVVYDDLSKQASAYRELSLLLRRPPGREAYPGDIFYIHARLLERAAKLDTEHGGGSLTALPIIETQLGDVAAYIPTNVISITDGQIYLESNLFYQGVRPAINVGLSVSRVGSSAQTKAMKKVAGRLRLELAQFRELQAFVQFASDLDENTKKRIERGKLLTEVLKQSDQAPLAFEKEIVIVYAALNGYMDDVPLSEVHIFEEKLFTYLDTMHRETIFDVIRKSGELTDESEALLKEIISEFKKIQ